MSNDQRDHPKRRPAPSTDLEEYADVAARRSTGSENRQRPRSATLPRRRLTAIVCLGVLIASAVAAVLLLVSGAAEAHTDLVSSNPAEGEVLPSAPGEITLSFTDDMAEEFSKLSLTIDGAEAVALKPSTDGGKVSAAVPVDAWPASVAGPEPVAWSVSYRVVSADGHPITGKLAFSAPPPASPEATQTQAQRADPSPESSRVQGEADTKNAGSWIAEAALVLALLLTALLAAGAVVRHKSRTTQS